MREKDFSEKKKAVDPACTEAAAAKPGRRKRIRRWGVAAACFAFLIFAGTSCFSQDVQETPSDLPLLSVSESTTVTGYEGYLAYEASELVNANPWNEEMELATLPVFRNPLTHDANGIPSGADFGKMRAFLLEVAGRLGLDTNGLTVRDNTPDEESKQKIIEKFQQVGDAVPGGYFNPTKWILEADGLCIEVDQTMTAKVSFDPAVSLPAEYHFTHDTSSYEDMAAVAEYLKTAYGDLIGMDNPQAEIYGGDYTIYGKQMYAIGFFRAGEGEREQVIRYNFDRMTFHCDDEGKLFIARIYQPDLSAEVGAYPIIGPEEAEALLTSGNYLTTVPYEFPGSDYVKKVELIYRTGEYEEYYMPYYRFYVELPEEKRENGLKTYGAYYVPAVERSYLSNMPTWDGSFSY